MAIDPATSLRDLALAVPGARRVLDQAGLDYCCHGDAPLARACEAAGLDVADALADLDAAARAPENVASFHDYRIDGPATVAAHLVEHNYPVERTTMAETSELLSQVAAVHGAAHPELRQVESLWTELCRRLHAHMHQELPRIDPFDGDAPAALAAQHAELVALVQRIRDLTGGYTPPEDGCDALRAVYGELEAFEDDLHEHVLLADGVLFRRG